MYYNNSTFPIFLYPTKTSTISMDKTYGNLNSQIREVDFDKVFLKNIRNKEKQDLFGYLFTILPSIIISDYRKFKRDELSSNFIIDENLFLKILNLRIDLTVIKKIIFESIENKLIKTDTSNLLIFELNLFIHQYVFIELSKCIISSEDNGKLLLFNIIKDSKKHIKYKSSDKNTSIDRIQAQKNFINGYINSFDSNDIEKIKEIEQDLIFMSNTTKQKKRVKKVFDFNIIFNDEITNQQKNKLRLYFFKNIIAKIYFKFLDNNDIGDYEVSEAFRTFWKRS